MDNNSKNIDELERIGKEYFKSLMHEIADDPLPDSEKLMKIANALHTLSAEDCKEDKEFFLKRFNDKYNLSLPLHRKVVHKKICKRGVILAFAVALLLSLFAAQAVATYNGINLFDFIREKFSGLSYSIANAAPDDFADDKNFADLKETITYGVGDIFNTPVLVFGKTPTGFTKEHSESKMFGEENIFFERYSYGDKYIIYMAEEAKLDGILSVQKEGKLIEQGKRIGKYKVDLSNNDDSFLAMFASGKMLYRIESNLPLTEIEEIIENLKENI